MGCCRIGQVWDYLHLPRPRFMKVEPMRMGWEDVDCITLTISQEANSNSPKFQTEIHGGWPQVDGLLNPQSSHGVTRIASVSKYRGGGLGVGVGGGLLVCGRKNKWSALRLMLLTGGNVVREMWNTTQWSKQHSGKNNRVEKTTQRRKQHKGEHNTVEKILQIERNRVTSSTRNYELSAPRLSYGVSLFQHNSYSIIKS